jgi:hypothetical protein
VAHGKELVEVCSAELPLADFYPQRYVGGLEVERSPLRLAAAYYDPAAGRLAVQASTPRLPRRLTFLDSPRVRRLHAELLPIIRERREASMRIKGAVGPRTSSLPQQSIGDQDARITPRTGLCWRSSGRRSG